MIRALTLSFLVLAAPAAFARPAVKGLAKADAELRAALVREPAYELSLSLDGEKAEFTGHEVIRFRLDGPADGLTVDFTGGKVAALVVNGVALAAPAPGFFFPLPKEHLKAGENVVTVDFSHSYSADGAGLYRFKDPEDGRVYLYSNFEPYDANKMFPAFDQPDLKATFALTVEAPAAWTVVSTASEEKIVASGARKTWTFAKTPKLSAYVFSVHAGPYHVWTSSAGAIPLRLFSRESLAKYIPHDEWLEVTRQGLAFYGDYFAFPYPFKKYDQLVVPDFNAGAMENVGAVTFSERYVFRSTPTLEDREDMAATILHEMAHMWFGDLVTMKWWNGLWLNESFATYMASLATGRATRFTRSWLSFFNGEKVWAYDTDQRETTHPVEGDVPDTEQAFANFDGITYGKGASTLKQLAYFIGPDAFRDGVRAYLKTHAYANATEGDFFGAMAKASGARLDAWVKEWLETTGVNSVRADYACAKGKISSFALVQSSDNGVLRSHRTMISLDDQEPVAVAYAGARTEVPALAGRPCPSLVFPNHGDEDYVKVELDARSLETVKAGLSEIRDPLARMMLWRTLWDMVRDAKWPVTEYAELIFSTLGDEADFKVASSVLETVNGRHPWSPSVLNYLPKPDYPRFERFFWANVLKSAPGGDFEKLWYDGYVELASSENGAAKLRGLLSGEAAVKGMFIDQDRRWSLIVRLAELGAPDAEALIVAETKRDPSDLGVKSAITARAARPDYETKSAWFSRIIDSGSKASLGEQRAAMQSFYPRSQRDLRVRFVEPFFKTLAELTARQDGDFLDDYVRAMLPALCTPESAAAFGDYVKKTPPSKPVVLRALRDAHQEETRCVKIRALAAGDPYAAMRDLYKRMEGEAKARIERGDYLGATRAVWRLAEAEPGRQELNFLLDVQSSYLAFVGDEAGARLAAARAQHVVPGPVPALRPAEASRAARAEVALEDPETVLSRAAETHQVIMISEAHHVAEHRAYGALLLPLLKKKGFTYLAMETLKYPLPSAPKRVARAGKPGELYGYYAQEPQMAGLIREALRLGFTLVAYEDETTDGAGDREEIQARNLQERIFKRDPKAKVVVWAGYGHVYKRAPRPGAKLMAQWFWEKTGLEPFSVYQESDALDPYLSESPRYKAFVLDAASPIAKPAILLDEPGLHPALDALGILGVDAGGKPIVDAYLFHPPYGRRTPSGLRPAWMSRAGFAPLAGSVAPAEGRTSENVLVQAFPLSEGVESVPSDQIPCDATGRFELWLREGDYILRVVGENGEVLKEVSARPGAPALAL